MPVCAARSRGGRSRARSRPRRAPAGRAGCLARARLPVPAARARQRRRARGALEALGIQSRCVEVAGKAARRRAGRLRRALLRPSGSRSPRPASDTSVKSCASFPMPATAIGAWPARCSCTSMPQRTSGVRSAPRTARPQDSRRRPPAAAARPPHRARRAGVHRDRVARARRRLPESSETGRPGSSVVSISASAVESHGSPGCADRLRKATTATEGRGCDGGRQRVAAQTGRRNGRTISAVAVIATTISAATATAVWWRRTARRHSARRREQPTRGGRPDSGGGRRQARRRWIAEPRLLAQRLQHDASSAPASRSPEQLRRALARLADHVRRRRRRSVRRARETVSPLPPSTLGLGDPARRPCAQSRRAVRVVSR